MWKSSLAVVFSFLIFPTVLSLYSRKNLGAGMVSNTHTNAGETKTRSQRSETFRYKAELSRQISNNIVDFIRSLIPAAQPKVDFMAESISDVVDAGQARILQSFENTNNAIKFIERFFYNMYEALVKNANDGSNEVLKPGNKNRRLLQRVQE